MADIFQNKDTVKCWRNVKHPDTGEYLDPSTSMTISIIASNGTYIEKDTAMEKDATGKYYFDFQSEGHCAGSYIVKYTATDGAHKSTFYTGFYLENEH